MNLVEKIENVYSMNNNEYKKIKRRNSNYEQMEFEIMYLSKMKFEFGLQKEFRIMCLNKMEFKLCT